MEDVRGKMVGDEVRSDVIPDGAPRMLMATTGQQRHLADVTADVRVGRSQSATVGAALEALHPVRRQFEASPHYLLAAASHLCDEGVLDEDYELADKLGIAIGDAALVLRRNANTDRLGMANRDALVSEFYPGADSDQHSRSQLVAALDVMQDAVAELRDDDVLIVLAR